MQEYEIAIKSLNEITNFLSANGNFGFASSCSAVAKVIEAQAFALNTLTQHAPNRALSIVNMAREIEKLQKELDGQPDGLRYGWQDAMQALEEDLQNEKKRTAKLRSSMLKLFRAIIDSDEEGLIEHSTQMKEAQEAIRESL